LETGVKKSISVVVPLYNEEAVIDELIARLRAILERIGLAYEIILVNDGSKDGTLRLARGHCHRDAHVKLVGFSRNFGHQIAVTAGLDKAKGDAVVIIDADLQDPPEVIESMVAKWREGYEIVYGVRSKREGETFFKQATAKLFYRLLQKLTPIDIPLDTGDFRLMDRRAVGEINRMRERNRFLRGMVSWVGFRQIRVEYVRQPRFGGDTKYPLRKMISFAMDGLLSFSSVPLRISSGFGLICSLISFGFIVYGLIVKILFPNFAIAGWASTFVAVLFIGGVQMVTVGILGEYVGRIYDEVKGRQLYVVDEELNISE
jgi:glycosyltransferase involved in cell wall biosynthesis